MTKLSLVASVAVASICAGSLAYAADSDAQMKAREALRQKMNELQTQPAPATSTPAAPAPRAIRMEAPSPAPTPAPAQAPVAVTPAPAAVPAAQPAMAASALPSDPEAIAKARAALRQTMQELDQPSFTAPMSETQAQPAASPGESGDRAKAQAALEQKMLEMGQTEPGGKPGAARVQTKPNKTSMAPLTTPVLEPLASPFSAEKQQKLAELLRRYMADELSPEEYHKERAKILAEP